MKHENIFDGSPTRDSTGYVHVPYNWVYATAALRDAATGFLPDDIGKLCRISGDNSLWQLIADSPAAWQQVGGGGGTPGSYGTYLVSGGGVVWDTGLTFRVAAAEYYILGTRYVSAETTVTLDAADATNARIDVLVLNTSSAADKVTGTAAATPTEPSINPATEIRLILVTVPALATDPSVTVENLYLENVEWTSTASDASLTLASTNNPRTGTKCVEGTTANSADWFMLTAASPITLSDYGIFSFFLRSKGSWTTARGMRIEWRLAGVRKGAALTLTQGFYNFDSTNTTDYQMIGINVEAFGVPLGQTVDEMRISVFGSGSIGFYFDDCTLQGAIDTAPNPGGGGSGTVTSVALSLPAALFDVTGSPVTTSGTLAATLDNQDANKVFAGPDTAPAATPTFRTLAGADLPVMVGDGGAGGTKGAVPAPGAGDAAAGKFLKADGTFAVPSGTGAGTGLSFLTATAEGTLSNETNLGALTTGMLKHTVAGGVSTPATATEGTDYYKPGGTNVAGTDMDAMTGDAGAGGAVGAVPAPGAGDAAAGKYLKADGTWAAPSGTGAPADAKYLTVQAEGGLSAEVNLGALTDGLLKITVAGGVATPATASAGTDYAPASVATSTIEIVIDGGGSAITTGIKLDVEIPFACTIVAHTLLADQSGSIVLDLWKDTYANFPPTVADTITASAKPTLSGAAKAQDSTLTGWTTSVSAGDILRINVDSVATVTRVTLSLKVTKA